MNERKFYKASITIETTYISVFVFFSIMFLVYFTVSTYNVSLLTSKAYYILENYVSGEANEELQESLYIDAYEASKFAALFNTSIETNVKTEFDQLSIVYQNKETGYEIQTSSQRERIRESMFFMKEISDAVSGGMKTVVNYDN